MKTTRNSSSVTSGVRRWQTGKRLIVAPSGIVLFIMILLLTLGGRVSYGQGVGISETSIVPESSSILELRSSLRGFLAPRMTTLQRLAITPVQGLLVYDTDKKCFFFWENSSWKAIAATGLGSANQVLGMDAAGLANEYKTLNGSSNILVSFVPGNINLTTSQDIHSAASPTFAGLKVSGLAINSGVYTDGLSFLTTSPPVNGILGYWSRTGTVLSPSNAGDAVTTSGNISTTGGGAISASGLLSGTTGLTITGGAVNLNSSSNNPTNINTGTSTGPVTIGNSLNTIILPAFSIAGLVHNSAAGVLSTGLLQNIDIADGTIDLPTKVTGVLRVVNGGTGQSSPLIPGGVLYGSTATAAAVTAAGSAGQILRSTGTTAPVWSTPTFPNTATLNKIMIGDGTNWLESTATYPNSTTANQILYSFANNDIRGLATANNSVLITSGTGVPSLSSTLPSAVQGNITTLGTITSGTWNGTIVDLLHGGTNTDLSGGAAIGDILYANTATSFARLADVATGNVLISGGIGAAPSWGKVDLGQHLTGILPLANGGTNADLSGAASNGGIVWSNATQMQILAGTATANKMLLSGSSTTPSWSAYTMPLSFTGGGELLYTTDASTVTNLAAGTTGMYLKSNGTGSPAWQKIDLSSTNEINNILQVGNGGTGISNITTNNLIYGNGTNPVSLLAPGGTTGALLTTTVSGAPGWLTLNGLPATSGILQVPNGGTGVSALNTHGVIIGQGTNAVSVTAAGTAGQVLQSRGSGADPTYSTAIYPTTTTMNELLYSSTGDNITGLTTASNGVLITSAAGAPSIGSTLPDAVQYNITKLGTITNGTWNGSILGLAYGGTNTDLTLGSPAIGDLLYGTATGFARLADAATGNVLISGGIGVAPSWGKVDLGQHLTGILPLANGGTNADLSGAASNGGIVWSNATQMQILAGTATANKMLLSGASSTPSWSNYVMPSTFGGGGELLYTTDASTVTNLAAGTTGMYLKSNGTGSPAWQKIDLSSTNEINNILQVGNGGTGISNITTNNLIYGNGTNPVSLLAPGGTTGALLTTTVSGAPGWLTLNGLPATSGILQVPNGGTGVSALNTHGVIIGQGTNAVSVTAAGTAGQVLQSRGSGADPTYSTAIYPTTTTMNELLYSSTGDNITGLTTASNGVLITSAAGAPSISSTLPDAVQYNITKLGTITNGTWNGSILGLAYGGTNTDLTLGSPAIGDLLYGTATGFARLADAAIGNVLISGGIGAAPSWGKVDLGQHLTGILPIANGGTNWNGPLANNRFMISSSGSIMEAPAMVDGQVIVGKLNAAPQVVTLGGDATINDIGALLISNDAISTVKLANNAVTYSKIQAASAFSRLLGSSDASTAIAEISLGSGLTLTGATLTASGLGGTVTNFSSGDLSPLFTTSVTNPATTPALSFSLSNAGAYTLFGNFTNALAPPTYFSPILASALFASQGAANSVLHGNAAGNPSWSQIVNADVDAAAGIVDTKLATITTAGKVNNSATTAISSNIANTIVLRDGANNFSAGTITADLLGNATTATTASNLALGGPGTIPYQSAANTTAMLGAGTAGQVLTSGGAGAPAWTTPTTGTVTSVTGTANRITVGGTASDPVVDIAGTYIGQNSITTLGTIITGTWNGTTIAIGNGGTGQTTQQAAINALTGGVTAGQYLRGDGTNVLMSAIQATDIPNIAESQVTGLVADLASKQAAGNYITGLTGDATASGPGSAALTLATVNSNTGALGSSTAIPTITTNAKGLVTAVTTNPVIAPAGTLTGTTLASNVVTSSLTSVGTLTDLTVTNPISGSITGNAGTATTASNLALGGPGTIPYQSAANTTAMLGAGTAGQVLTSGGAGAPAWTTPTTGTVTSVTGTANRITVGGTASDPVVDIAGTYIGQNSITTLGTIITGTWNGTTIAIGNGGTGQTTQQAAINALTGGVTAGQYLRGDGTNVLMSAIQATDIPNIAESQVTGLVADLASKQAAGNYITGLTGDATASGPGSAALTLATVNSNTGALGSSTAIPTITTNAKGLVTAVTTNPVIAPAGTLTGTTLASNVVTSSLTSVGTLTDLTVTNPISGSITGNAGTAAIASNLALGGPGTIPYQSAANTTAMLGAGTAGQVLTSGGAGAPAWTTPTTGTVSNVSVTSANGLSGTVANATTTPVITLSTTVTGILKGNGTAITAAAAGTDYISPNGAITGATKTKITYDSKGLVTAGADATTADIAPSTNRNYVTDAQQTIIGNTSGINTGDQTLAGLGGVPTSRTINGKNLSADITLGLASTDFANQGTTTTLLHGNAGGALSFGAVTLTTDVTGILPVANGGTGSGTQNFVDLTTAQSIGGAKTFTGAISASNMSGTNTGDNAVNSLYSGLVTNATHTGEVTGSTALTITNGAVTYAKIQNIPALSVFGQSANASGVGVSISATAASNAILRESGSTIGFGSINLASSGAVGASILPLANGGTGSSTQNFVDLTTAQTIGGAKTFTGTISASNLSGTNTGDQTNITGNAGTATIATTATNLAGGGAGQIPYQTGAGATAMLATGTSGYILTSNGAAAPSWQPTSGTWVDLTSAQTIGGVKTFSSLPVFSTLTSGSVTFAGASGALSQDNANLFWDNTNKRLGIGTDSPSATLTVLGNVNIDGSGSTTAAPRTVGINPWGANNAARYTFGDPVNSLQNAFGGKMQIQSYWGMEIAGNRESGTPLDFSTTVLGTDPSLTVYGTLPAADVLAVTAAAGQTANLQEWRNSGGAALASISSDGSFTTSGKIVSEGAIIHGAFNFGVDSNGTSDAYAVALTPAPRADVPGMMIVFKSSFTNIGTATMNINSLGGRTIVRGSGAALQSGDIANGGVYILVYDGTNFYLIR